jgi:hypothetical protein
VTARTTGGCGDGSRSCGELGCGSRKRSHSSADLDQRRDSVLVRPGKGGRRREVGMDVWGWELLAPWLETRLELPV